jgi:uncharacterized protein
MELKLRVEKDITKFYDNVARISAVRGAGEMEIVELSKMYASDAKSYLVKGELDTAFSCISYAHGLLDAVLKLSEK